jgi:hypothetical protein
MVFRKNVGYISPSIWRVNQTASKFLFIDEVPANLNWQAEGISMQMLSMKEFSKDLLQVFTTTVDGFLTAILLAFFLLRSLYMVFMRAASPSVLVEGMFYSIIVLLVLIQLRLNIPATKKICWGALTSVLAFAICILTMR